MFFESPHRLADTLAAAVEVLGPDRAAAVCRELTKTHEEVLRGPLAELAGWAAVGPVRGEITVVLAGAAPAVAPPVDSLVAAVRERVADGERLKEAVRVVAAEQCATHCAGSCADARRLPTPCAQTPAGPGMPVRAAP